MKEDQEWWDQYVCPGCSKEMNIHEMEQVYDRQGIYAGRWCSHECASKHLILDMSAQDYAEAGENISWEY